MWVNRVKCLIFSQIFFLSNPLSGLRLQILIILYDVKVPQITVAWGMFDSASCIANILPQVITTNTSSPSPQSSPLPSDTILTRCRCVAGVTVSMGSLGDLMMSDDDDGLSDAELNEVPVAGCAPEASGNQVTRRLTEFHGALRFHCSPTEESTTVASQTLVAKIS